MKVQLEMSSYNVEMMSCIVTFTFVLIIEENYMSYCSRYSMIRSVNLNNTGY